MTTFMVKNKYVDTSIQKGGIPGLSGCLEHTGILSKLIPEPKECKGNLTVIWLDLTNAYGSIPHGLINAAPLSLALASLQLEALWTSTTSP